MAADFKAILNSVAQYNATEPSKRQDLPDLTPEMLLSSSALREVEYMTPTQWSAPTIPSIDTFIEPTPFVMDESPPVDDFYSQFSFDVDEGAAEPNEAVRFQVGREDPPPSTFYADAPRERASDGTVVGTRRANGRWEVPRSQAPRPSMITVSAPIRIPPAPAPAPKAQTPTMWQRLK